MLILTTILNTRLTNPPVSILPNLSKICERFMKNQMYPYLNQIFSNYQCEFRKGFNAQHCLMTMIEKWCKFLDIEVMHVRFSLTSLRTLIA